MMRTRLALLLIFSPMGVFAAQLQAPAIEVHSLSSSKILLQINQQSDVQTVLQAFCEQVHFQCDIVAEARRTRVAPMAVSGTWDQVVGKILEGTNLNYVGVPAVGPGQSGRLLVEMSSPVTAGNSTAANSATEPSVQTLSEPVEAIAQNTPTAAEVSQEQNSNDADAQVNEPAPEPPAGMAFTPFPGADGKQLLVPSERPTTMLAPFPDQNGQPIEVPLNGERPPYLPFPGPDGRPIPMPPPAPAGTVTPNPFPTTPH